MKASANGIVVVGAAILAYLLGAVPNAGAQAEQLSLEKVSPELRSLYAACERIAFRIPPEPLDQSTAQALGFPSADSLRTVIRFVYSQISQNPAARSINAEVFLNSYMRWAGIDPNKLVSKFGERGFHISNSRSDGEGLWTLLVQFPLAQLPDVSTETGFIGLAAGAEGRPASSLYSARDADPAPSPLHPKKNSAMHR